MHLIKTIFSHYSIGNQWVITTLIKEITLLIRLEYS